MVKVQSYTVIIKNASIGQNRHKWNENDGELSTLCHSNWSEVKKSIDMLKDQYALKDCKDFIVSHGEEAKTGEPDLKDENFNATSCSWLKFDSDKVSYSLFSI